MKIYYNPKLKQIARNLRNNSTLSEVLLWNELKNKQLGYRFMRQKPIGDFIVDLYCAKLRLAIEIDGDSHGYDFVRMRDSKKEEFLKSIGISLIRYDDLEVKQDISSVIAHLESYISSLNH